MKTDDLTRVTRFVRHNWLHATMQPDQIIYALCDPCINQARYIGHTANLQKRYQGHLNQREGGTNEQKGIWIDGLLTKGLYPIPITLEYVETLYLVGERERRWMFHYFQRNAPLLNSEARYKHLIAAIQHTDVDYLTLPLSSYIWLELIEECNKDRKMLGEWRY